MKKSTIILIVVGVLVLIGAIVAIVMLTKKDNSANVALAGILDQPIVEQGGSLSAIGNGIAGIFGGGKKAVTSVLTK